MFIGSFADSMGRRPAYIICFVVYIAANIGLAMSQNYASLLGIRALQAAGMQTLCQAVVADITTSAERGQYIGFITLSAILGPSLGPVISGALADRYGWRSIFWFLVIAGGTYLVLMLFLFPETCRLIVGDGSINPPKTHETLLELVKAHRGKDHDRRLAPTVEVEDKPTKDRFGLKHLFTSIVLICDKELGLLLAYSGLVFSGINAISAALPSQFTDIYGFNSLQIGLVFLPFVAGSVISVIAVGKLLNWNYLRHAKKLGLTVDMSKQIDLANFPIERARLEIAMPFLYLTATVMIAWGWALNSGRRSLFPAC